MIQKFRDRSTLWNWVWEWLTSEGVGRPHLIGWRCQDFDLNVKLGHYSECLVLMPFGVSIISRTPECKNDLSSGNRTKYWMDRVDDKCKFCTSSRQLMNTKACRCFSDRLQCWIGCRLWSLCIVVKFTCLMSTTATVQLRMTRSGLFFMRRHHIMWRDLWFALSSWR